MTTTATTREQRCAKCGRTATEVHRLHYFGGAPTGCDHEWPNDAEPPRQAEAGKRDSTSPTPWRVMDGAILSDQINDYSNFIIADCNRERTSQDEANLRLIARAVNSHATLVAALEVARQMSQYIVELSDKTSINNARQQARQAVIVTDEALAKVRGKK